MSIIRPTLAQIAKANLGPLASGRLPWEPPGGAADYGAAPRAPSAVLGSILKGEWNETLQSGSPIDTWTPANGSATAWAATLAKRPATGRTINGLAAPDCPGTSDMTGGAKSTMISAAAYWWLGVIIVDTVTSASTTYYLNDGLLSDTGQYMWAGFRNNAGAYSMGVGHNEGAVARTVSTSITLGAPFLFEWGYNGVNIMLRIGSAAAVQVGAASVGAVTQLMHLATNWNAALGIDGAIGDLLVCNAYPTAAQIAECRAYAANKWAVAA